MKKTAVAGWALVAAVAILCPVDASQAAVRTDVTAGFLYLMPSDNQNYDSGYGVEAQMRFWVNPRLALAIAGGGEIWKVTEQTSTADADILFVTGTQSGSVNLFPIGGSVWLRPLATETVDLSVEVGARYVIVKSRADVEVTLHNSPDPGVQDGITLRDRIAIENGVIGVVGLNLEVKPTRALSLFGGVGYQFDITKGKVSWLGFGSDDDNRLEAFQARIGLGVAL